LGFFERKKGRWMLRNGWILVEENLRYVRCGVGREVIRIVVASHSAAADTVVTTPPPIFTGAWMGWNIRKTEAILLKSSFSHADTRHKAEGGSPHRAKEFG